MSFEKNVFINCPFDNEYFPILKAIIFTVLYLGYEPQISETSDSGANRLAKIKELIFNSKYSIHDLSRIGLNNEGLPRFNMPFECGVDLGAKLFGEEKLRDKVCLILEKEKYRYQKFISDISGNDIRAHKNDPEKAVKNVRDWLKINTEEPMIRHSDIWLVFNEFESDYVDILEEDDYDPLNIESITFTDIIEITRQWIESRKEQK